MFSDVAHLLHCSASLKLLPHADTIIPSRSVTTEIARRRDWDGAEVTFPLPRGSLSCLGGSSSPDSRKRASRMAASRGLSHPGPGNVRWSPALFEAATYACHLPRTLTTLTYPEAASLLTRRMSPSGPSSCCSGSNGSHRLCPGIALAGPLRLTQGKKVPVPSKCSTPGARTFVVCH